MLAVELCVQYVNPIFAERKPRHSPVLPSNWQSSMQGDPLFMPRVGAGERQARYATEL